ncbi:MAG: 1-deoxy-D-xylulose-5-phosphate synthase [Chitinivibrionales bacterium]|nr:1-deoxy-D-xylulose-5-phosphate synthase [Chitinivibrionales bacterium]
MSSTTTPPASKEKKEPRKKKASRKVALLSRINSPADLRQIPQEKLPRVADEIRHTLLEKVSKHGGHLAPSLGATDLIIALHYCYTAPRDKLIFDVGHQAYAHKLLTGRRDNFSTLRQYRGISGFPRVGESEFDTVSVGHASTSISTGLGIAKARDLRDETFDVVSIIGDGSLTGGLAFEGLNNLGSTSTRMTVILNDNEMSISKNVGAMSRYLMRVITDRRFHRLKSEIWQLLGNLSNVGKGIRNVVHNLDDALRHFVIPGKLFEDMGLRYFGPVDGHNIDEMIEVFKFVKENINEPTLIHVITKKGKGYRFAEKDATKYHGIGSFSVDTGHVNGSSSGAPKYSSVFGKTVTELAKDRPAIVAVTAAMPDGTGLSAFRDTYPERFFDVGIAESHAVTFAAGLALQGMTPVVGLYSTFLQRTYDQLVHDLALDNLHVVFGIDRAGLVGDDGPTHHGVLDLSFLRTIPNVTIMSPRNENELRNMVFTAITECKGPVFIRYPRGGGTGEPFDDSFTVVQPHRPEVLRKGGKCAVITAGDFCYSIQDALGELAHEGIAPTLVNARYVKPLDRRFYEELFESHPAVVTIEHNSIAGGFGSGILELAASLKLTNRPAILTLGYPDHFVEHGNRRILLEKLCLDTPNLTKRIVDFVNSVV